MAFELQLEEWGSLWQADAGERPFQTEEDELQKDGAGRRMSEKWSWDSSCFCLAHIHEFYCAPLSSCTMAIMSHTRWGWKFRKGPVQTRLWRPFPGFYLKSNGEAAFEVFVSRGITCRDVQFSKFPGSRAHTLWTGGGPGLHQTEQPGRRPLQAAWKTHDGSLDKGASDGDGEQ